MTFKVFGYGSLVNRGTLPPFVAAEQRTVRGWRRAWRASSVGRNGGVCALSVVPDPDAVIDGLVLTFDEAVFPIIRQREHNYDILRLDEDPDVIVFRARAEVDHFGDQNHPIHKSYLDATLQGFIKEFGEGGASRFMASTEGWHVPILDDRQAPHYPRAQILSSAEQLMVDRLLESVDAGRTLASESRDV